jgi:hypothetical protein
MKTFLLAFLLLASLAQPSPAATITVNSTTFAADVAKTDTDISVASVSNILVGDIAYHGREGMRVQAINGTVLTVSRGYEGLVSAHPSGATVYIDRKTYFGSSDRGGGCTAATEPVLPVINMALGNVWQCTASIWTPIVQGGFAVSGSGDRVYTTSPGLIAPRSTGQFFPTITVSTVTTASAVTLTAAQILGGLILEDPNGGAATATLPTAALLLAAIPGAVVGTSFEFTIRNTADAAETITVAGGTGGTISGTATIAQNNSKRFLVRLTNVTAASEAYTVYSLGTIVH